MLIGYARVSSHGQSLDRQIGALNAASVDKIFREKVSGKTVKGRPQLERAIDALGAGDVFVIAEWDRARRSMIDGITIIQRIADRGACVKVLDKPWLDLTTPMGKGILAFLSALAEDERERITRRANEGRVIAPDRALGLGANPSYLIISNNLHMSEWRTVKAVVPSPWILVLLTLQFRGCGDEQGSFTGRGEKILRGG